VTNTIRFDDGVAYKRLAYARTRPALASVQFRDGDAYELPFPSAAFDVAVMPLVVFFLSVPARGVAEMARVARPGGVMAAYAWDMPGGGFPYATLFRALKDMGRQVPAPPSPEASRIDSLRQLWSGAGAESVATTEIVVERTFVDFDDYWNTVLGAASMGALIREMSPDDARQLQDRLRAALPTDATGRITYSARANAVRGMVGRPSS